jgi:hypothetical protein
MINTNQATEPIDCPNCGSHRYKKIDEWTNIYNKHTDLWECECGFIWKEDYTFTKWEAISIPIKS